MSKHETSSQQPASTPKASRLGVTDLLLLFTSVVWGVNVVIVKIALSELAPLPFNALRFLTAALLSYGLLRWREPNSRVSRADIPAIIGLGLLGHTLYQVFFISGINLTTAGNTSLLLAVNPIWVAILASLVGREHLRWQAWCGIALSFLGIFLVTVGGGKEISFAAETTRGDLLVLGGTLVFAIYTIMSKPYLSKYTPLQWSTYTMIAGAGGLMVASVEPLCTQDWSTVSARGWGGLIYSAVFAIVVGYYVWNNGVQKLGAARTAIYSNLSPVIAMLTGWLVLSERITLPQLAGAGLIITGLYIARSSRLARKAK